MREESGCSISRVTKVSVLGPETECQSIDTTGSVLDLKGECLDQIIAAAESLELTELIEQYLDLDSPLGAAITLLQCGEAKCVNECYAPCSSLADGMSCDAVLNDVQPRVCTQGKCPDDYFYIDLADAPISTPGTPSP